MSASLRTGLSKDERSRSWFDKYILSELALRQAQGERVEGLTMSGCFGVDSTAVRNSQRLEGIFGFSPRAAISFVSRSTARSTGRLSATEMGVRPAPFSSSSFAP